MGISRQHKFLVPILFAALAACNPAKHLPADEKLYTGATVKLNTPDVTARERKTFRSDLQGLTRPRPNSRLLGIPVKLSIYNMFRKAKAKSFFGKLRDKYGEPPVLLSSVDLARNVTVLQNHLENKGFFHAKVTGDTVVKAKKGTAVYTADAGTRYRINTVHFGNDTLGSDTSLLVRTIRESAAQSFLKVGDPFDLDVIRGERNRIDAYLKERGFYYFSPDHLIIRVDSTIGDKMVDMIVAIKPETPADAQDAYRINDVFIYSGYRLNAAAGDTSKANAEQFEGYYVIDRRKRFKPKMFAQIMQFDPGDIYSRSEHNQTLSRLINLNEFKFVQNRFERVADSTKLDAYYYLTPLPRKSLRAEVNTTTRSNNQNGSQISLTFRNRNTFRAGEHFSLSAYIGSDVQMGGNFQGYNTYRTGAEANFTIPRFVIPILDIRTRGNFVPRTNIQLGYDVLNRRKLYTLNSFRGGLGYLWKESLQKSHEFYPVSINYVQPINVTGEFYDSVRKYPYLNRIVDSQFILGTTYQYNFNQLATGVQKTNSFYFNGLIDLSGNVAGLLSGANVKAGKQQRIMSAAFDQYIKLEADGRYYRKIGLKSTWANRAIIGYGNPYGNSLYIPYVKQFFVGGNNSVRAFRSRSLLGTYREVDTSGFLPDQTGDMKLEFNTEFRPHISGPIYGAIFVDAGNAWLKNEDPDRIGAKFTRNFMKELAVGAGVGLRVDIQLFVIRLDAAFPLRKPWEQNPWVMNQIRLHEKAWRRDNIIYNLAIGYPF